MAGWVDRVRELDETIEKWIEPHRSPSLDRVFYGLSSAADHGMLWHAFGLLRAVKRREPRYAFRFSAVLGLESILTNGVIKSFFKRVRPAEHFAHNDPLPYGMRRPIS